MTLRMRRKLSKEKAGRKLSLETYLTLCLLHSYMVLTLFIFIGENGCFVFLISFGFPPPQAQVSNSIVMGLCMYDNIESKQFQYFKSSNCVTSDMSILYIFFCGWDQIGYEITTPSIRFF